MHLRHSLGVEIDGAREDIRAHPPRRVIDEVSDAQRAAERERRNEFERACRPVEHRVVESREKVLVVHKTATWSGGGVHGLV